MLPAQPRFGSDLHDIDRLVREVDIRKIIILLPVTGTIFGRSTTGFAVPGG